MSKFEMMNNEEAIESKETWPWTRNGIEFKSMTAAQLLAQIPRDTKWPEPKISWKAKLEIHNIAGDRLVTGISEINVKSVDMIVIYSIPLLKDRNPSHLSGFQIINFLESQPKDRRVITVIEKGNEEREDLGFINGNEELRPIIGYHVNDSDRSVKDEDKNKDHIKSFWLQAGPIL